MRGSTMGLTGLGLLALLLAAGPAWADETDGDTLSVLAARGSDELGDAPAGPPEVPPAEAPAPGAAPSAAAGPDAAPSEASVPPSTPPPLPAVVVEGGAVPAPCTAPSARATPTPRTGRVYHAAPFRDRRRCCVSLRLDVGGSMLKPPEGTIGPATGNPTQMTWDALEDEGSFAGRFTVAWTPCRDWRVLASGACYCKFEGEGTQTGVIGFQQTPGGPVLATPTTTAELQTEGELASGEVHAWRTLCRGPCVDFDVGLGLRYVGFDEEASGVLTAPFPNAGGTPSFSSEVENRFWGGQLGGLVRWDPNSCWTFFAGLKGLVGFMDRTISVQDDSFFVGGPHASTIEDSGFGWGVDFELGVDWHFHPCWSLGASYQVLVMGEMVRGYESLDFTQGGTGAVQARQVTDTLMAHTVFVGLTWRP